MASDPSSIPPAQAPGSQDGWSRPSSLPQSRPVFGYDYMLGRVRESLSREHLINSMKTLAWVIPLTLLIWVYAERAGVNKDKDQVVPIDVHSADPNRLVTLKMPNTVLAELEGPRALLDEVERWKDPPRVVINVDPTLPPGQHELRAAVELNNQLGLKGITVNNCKPENLLVQIDTLETREAQVRIRPEMAKRVAATFDRKTVRIRGPQSELARIASDLARAGDELYVYADLPDALLKSQPHTEQQTLPLSRPPLLNSDNISLLDETVGAKLEVKQADEPYLAPSIPVWVLTPPGLTDKYRVVYPDADPMVHNVKLTGPSESIKLVKPGASPAYPAKAYVELNNSDTQSTSHALKFDLPPGVTVSEDAPRTFDVKLVPRE